MEVSMTSQEGLNPSVGMRIESLLDQLLAQTKSVGDSWREGEASRLRMLAGQLSAVADGSGESSICEWAEELETLLLAEDAEVSATCEKIEALILQCRNATEAS